MKLENILRNIVIGGAFILLLTPLIVAHNMYFPYIVGKAFYFRIIVEIMFAAWAILAYANPAYRPKRSLVIAAVGFFVSVIALADIFSVNAFSSFWSNYERMEGFVGLLHVAAYFLILATTLSSEILWTRFFQASLFVGIVINFFALGELVSIIKSGTGAIRLAANFGNSEYLAAYTLVHFFIAAFLFVRTRVRWEQVVYGLVGVFNAFILYYTATRGALLGFIGGVLLTALLVVLLGRHSHKHSSSGASPLSWKIAVGVVVATIMLVGGFFAIKDTQFVAESPVLSRFASISLTEQTVRSRLMVWQMAWEGFKERPVLGWGQENFIEVFNKHYNPKMHDQEPWFDRAHNVFFDWLVAGGALGLLGYLGLFVAALFVLWRRTPLSIVEKSILTGLLGAYFAHNLFVFDHLVSYILFFGLLGFLAHYERIEHVQKKRTEHSMHVHIIAPVVIVLVITAGYYLNYRPFMGNLTLLHGLEPHRTATGLDWQPNLDAFERALVYTDGTLGSLETRSQLTRAAMTAIKGAAPASKDIQTEFAELTVVELKKEIDRSESNILAHLLLGTFLNEMGKSDDAIVEFQIAHELSPTKQDILLQLGSAYLGKADYQKAVAIFKEAYDLEPGYLQAKKGYAIALIYNGNEKEAKALYGGSIPLDPDFAGAYATRKEYGKSTALWEAIVKANPSNAQYHIYLGINYLYVGRSDAAIAQLEEAVKIQPELAAKVEQYLKEIKSGSVTF